jgi:hypothetical protein
VSNANAPKRLTRVGSGPGSVSGRSLAGSDVVPGIILRADADLSSSRCGVPAVVGVGADAARKRPAMEFELERATALKRLKRLWNRVQSPYSQAGRLGTSAEVPTLRPEA